MARRWTTGRSTSQRTATSTLACRTSSIPSQQSGTRCKRVRSDHLSISLRACKTSAKSSLRKTSPTPNSTSSGCQNSRGSTTNPCLRVRTSVCKSRFASSKTPTTSDRSCSHLTQSSASMPCTSNPVSPSKSPPQAQALEIQDERSKGSS